MTALGRVTLGAVVGALVTLAAHPSSRPFLLAVAIRPDASMRQFLNPAPTEVSDHWTLEEAAERVHLLADKLANDGKLSSQELETAIELSSRASATNPTNAFWMQARAVFHRAQKRPTLEIKDWLEGASRPVWNDYQSELLNDRRRLLGDKSPYSPSWHLAYLYRQRSFAMANLVEDVARALLENAKYASPKAIQIRYATVMNGARMRDGSRSVRLGGIGVDIVELGAYPSALSRRRNPRRLLLGENLLFTNLMEAGKTIWGKNVQYQFDQNEAWQALADYASFGGEARQLGLESVFCAVLPGALLATSLIGGLLWGLGHWVGRGQSKRFRRRYVVLIAISLGACVQFLTSFPIAAIAAGLCGGFVAASPDQQRSIRPKEFGPAFTVAIGFLSVAFGINMTLFFIGTSLPGRVLLPYLQMPAQVVGGSALFIGLALLSFSALFLVTPFWALVQRLSTPFVFSQGLQRFGASLLFVGLFAAVISGPIAVYADQSTGAILSRLLSNEPIFYLNQHATRTEG